MELNEALKKVSVIGAAGKMGRGISFLLLQEIVRLRAENKNEVYRLKLIDVNDYALHSLRQDLKEQLTHHAEKNINVIRTLYANQPALVSNGEIIQAFVEESLEIVYFDTDFEAAKDSKLIFEAIVENVDVKSKVFLKITQNNPNEPCIFTNTSSIPISVLNEKANLKNKIVGFHFYNPPAVQKLVELIVPETTDQTLQQFAYEMVARLHKISVTSADIAGFIGNGQFMREILFACQKVREFQREFSSIEAIYMINKLTQEWLIRPMGIFQLIDYVGLDICQKIAEIMQTYLGGEKFHDELIDSMNAAGIMGGQYSNGMQKNGFFQYEKNVPVGIYSLKDRQYHLFSQEKWKDRVDNFLGPLPEGHFFWKELHKDPDKNLKLEAYFQSLFEYDAFGAELAQVFLFKCRDIAQKLVEQKVARNIEDVNLVVINGFHQLYGPQNPWLPEQLISRKK